MFLFNNVLYIYRRILGHVNPGKKTRQLIKKNVFSENPL